MHPPNITLTVTECGCPAGRYRADAARHDIHIWNDDDEQALLNAYRKAKAKHELNTPAEAGAS